MQLWLVVSVYVMATIHVMSATCPGWAATFDYAGQYCQADVVFTGRAVSGVSGVAIDTDGSQIESARHDFRVSRSFKGVTGPRPRTVSVARTYTQSDPCDSAFLHPGYSVHLVFARDNTGLSVPACRGTIPWPCVPRAARQALARQTC